MSIGITASQAFSPNKLSGLMFWLDAADTGTIVSLDNMVSEWKDKSVLDNNAVQLTGSKQPISGLNTINGQNVITYDGINTAMLVERNSSIDDIFLGGGSTFFAALPITAGEGNFGRIFQKSDNTIHFLREPDDTSAKYAHISDFLSVRGSFNTLNEEVELNTENILSVTYDTSIDVNRPTFYVNGDVKSLFVRETPSGLPGSDSSDDLFIGNNQMGNRTWNGHFGEIVFYNRILDSFENFTMQRYLASKWGVDSSFSPDQLDDLVLWLDADDEITITDVGGVVSQWNSKIGSSVLTATGGPLTGINTVNGLNVIAFDGANDFMFEPTLSAASANMTIFIVANVLAVGSEYDSLFHMDSSLTTSFQIESGSNNKFFTQLNRTGLGEDNVVSFDDSFLVDDNTPTGISFKPDGTKMYIVGMENKLIYQYALSVPFDITVDPIFEISEQLPADAPFGCVFDTNGLNVFNVDNIFDAVFSSPLNLPYDISTIGSGEFSFIPEVFELTGLDFNPDGSKMYLVEENVGSIQQYILGDAFHIGNSPLPEHEGGFLITEDTSPQDVRFNPEGTKMYVVGGNNAAIYQYSLPLPFNLVPQRLEFSDTALAEDPVPTGITFNPTGTKLFIVGEASSSVHQYTLPTPFDISVKTLDTSFILAIGIEELNGISFNTAGTKMFVTIHDHDSIARIDQYTLTASFDIATTPTLDTSFSVISDDNKPLGVTFNDDGSKMYVTGSDGDAIYQYNLANPFDLNTVPTLDGSFSVTEDFLHPTDVVFNPDGTKMLVSGVLPAGKILQYNMVVPFDITVAPKIDGYFLPENIPNLSSLAFILNDGLKLYVVSEGTELKIAQYSLPFLFAISPITLDGSMSTANEETTPTGVTFDSTGNTMYVCGSNSAAVHQYSLAKPFDIISRLNHDFDAIGSPNIFTHRFSANDNDVNLRINGASLGARSYNGALSTNALSLFLGVDRSLNNFLNADIAEVLIYDRDLSFSETVEVEDYLSEKWAVELGFPLAFSKDFSSDFA